LINSDSFKSNAGVPFLSALYCVFDVLSRSFINQTDSFFEYRVIWDNIMVNIFCNPLNMCFCFQTIEVLTSVPCPELALRLYLQCAEAASDCDLEPVAYEFFTQAFMLYEEEIADSKAQVTAIHLIVGTLQRINVFGVENRDTLTHKATGYSARLLKKPDQCRAVYACSHLFWVDDPDGIKDGERVLLCLRRALRIANAAQQMASATRGSSGPVTLFVEILNKYIYFFEKGNPHITPSDIQSLIELINNEMQSDNGNTTIHSDPFFTSTLRYIKFIKQKGGLMGEKYDPIKL
jgi:vacuolar protein sorting-associated protein 35